MRQTSSSALRGLCLVVGCLAPAAALEAAPWLIFSEVHFHPPGDGEDEFVEICNLEPPAVELGGWTLEGEISFRFPEGLRLRHRECIVIARKPSELAKRHAGASLIVGPFEGRLDNKGGRVVLRRPEGAVAAVLRYDRDGDWPRAASGSGRSLELRDPLLDATSPGSWRASREDGGTPGKLAGLAGPTEGRVLVPAGATWRYRRGRTAVPARWIARDFDDSSWEEGPGGFGYGDGDDRTQLADMRGSYLGVYTRILFDRGPIEPRDRLILRVDYDDAFVAYLNGREVERVNIAPSGSEVRHDTPAEDWHEAGTAEEFDLGEAAALLEETANVLAVSVHNKETTSTDLSLAVELFLRPGTDAADRKAISPRINELHLGVEPAGDWIEIFNPASAPRDVSGCFISDDASEPKKSRIASDVIVSGRRRVAIRLSELQPPLELEAVPPSLFLTGTDGESILDAVVVDLPSPDAPPEPGDGDADAPDEADIAAEDTPAESAGDRWTRPLTLACQPDGEGELRPVATPTEAATNRIGPLRRVVISEIHYRALDGLRREQFVEIHNDSPEAIELDGWKLRRGIRFDFPPAARCESAGRVVVAADPEWLRQAHGLDANQVFGPFDRRLSARGETIELRDAADQVVDRVRYGDRHPWPRAADGGGSSLERRHSRLDGALGASWAASDETLRSGWTELRYTKRFAVHENGDGTSLQLLLLSEGRCLVDDIEVREEGAAMVARFDFDRARDALDALGTHQLSGRVDVPAGDGRCLELVATGRGNSRENFVSLPLGERLREGREYTVTLRARWQEGSPLLLTRTPGQGLARLHRLPVPPGAGTPGRVNSRRQSGPALVVGVPRQWPVSPRPSEAVQVRVPISGVPDLSGTVVTIHHRRHGTSPWQSVELEPGAAPLAGDLEAATVFHGEIPPQSDDLVEFFVRARDASGIQATYPDDAPQRTALYAVGLTPHGSLPTYTVLVSDAQWRAFQERPRLSNFPMDATLVHGKSHIFYNVEFRLRGSPFTRSRRNWRLTFGDRTLDGRRSLTFDGQGGRGASLNERLTFWLVDSLGEPSPRQRFVHVNIAGHESGLYEDVEKVNGSFLSRWFEEDESGAGPIERQGLLHKVDDYWELGPGEDGRQRRRWRRDYIEAFLDYRGLDPEAYRWNFPPRLHENVESFEPLAELLHTLDPSETDDAEFARGFRDMADVENWLRVLAARTFANDWDSIGLDRGKNAYLYRAPADGRWRLLPWDADLSWGRSPYSRLFSRKFPAVRRLLEQPELQRQFLGHLEYLARHVVEPRRFEAVLDDIEALVGTSTDSYWRFGLARRDFVLQELPRFPFTVEDVERREGAGLPDRLLLRGTAPVSARSIRLAGRTAPCEPEGLDGWSAEVAVGPAGGSATVEALDFGGEVVARTRVDVPPGSDTAVALADLAQEEPSPEVVVVDRRVEPVASGGGSGRARPASLSGSRAGRGGDSRARPAAERRPPVPVVTPRVRTQRELTSELVWIVPLVFIAAMAIAGVVTFLIIALALRSGRSSRRPNVRVTRRRR